MIMREDEELMKGIDNDCFAQLYIESASELRKRFSRGEIGMMIDVMNGTMLDERFSGESLIVNVLDSFDLYPGMYEEKWDIEKDSFLKKLLPLSPFERTVLETWVVDFWEEGHNFDKYISGPVRRAVDLPVGAILKRLDEKVKIPEHLKEPVTKAVWEYKLNASVAR
jgi:hypothetical protein